MDPEVRAENSRAMAQKRWMADDIADAEMKQYFETVDLDTAMEVYQRMRVSYELAGKILDGRFQAERQAEERCSNPACRKQFDRNTPWYYRNTERNPVTNAPFNVFACSPACMIAIKAVGTQQKGRPSA